MSKKSKREYSVLAYISGNYFPLQRALIRRFGETVGSGYCFLNGERDLQWQRSSLASALRLEELIRRTAKALKKRVRVEVQTY